MAKASAIGLALIDSNDVTLGKVLGAGGFGTVYMATHVNWGRIAVKRLNNIRLTDSHQKEAEKMLRSLTSPYLVRIMGLIENPDGVDIVMEFFEYGSLKEFEKKYMNCDCWARKIKMIQDIAFGMNFLHTLNPPITHRDLKLENVFVGQGFAAKIGDFGLAVSSTRSRERAGSAGTISHMPPEAFESVDVEPDEAWDIYTFGITAYELTTGRDPWPQLNTYANATLLSHWLGKGHRPNLDVIPSNAPAEIVEIVTSCWVAQPKERPRFINILRTVTELFETKYERSLLKADRAISDQMVLVQESSDRKAQSVDSGWGSLETWRSKEKANETATPKQNERATPTARPKRNETATPSEGNTDRDKGDLAIEKGKDVRENQKAIDPDASEDVKNTSREEKDQPSDAACGVSGATGGLGSLNLEDHNESNQDQNEDLSTVVQSDKDLTLKYKHSIETPEYIESCCWIDLKHLAVCQEGCVRVYEVTTSSSRLAYTVTSKKWKTLLGKAKEVRGVAVSESLPYYMYAICEEQPYVYQFPCRESSKEMQRYKIPGGIKDPNAIAANANNAIIADYTDTVMVCDLPGFTLQRTIRVGFSVLDISVNSEYIVLMGDKKIIVKTTKGDMTETLCEIERPSVDHGRFSSVCIGNLNNGVRELYASCNDFIKPINVYKYTFEEIKEVPRQVKPKYIGRVITGDIGYMYNSCMSLTSDHIMALGTSGSVGDVKIYKLE